MPKTNLKNPFARRKSSGNILDTVNSSGESSFRILDRSEIDKKPTNVIKFDSPDNKRASNVQRPFASPLEALRGKSVDDLTYSAGGTVDTAASRRSAASLQKLARESAGTIASNSSDPYQASSSSARHSSSSTLPSSVDQEQESDPELFAKKWEAAKRPLPRAPSAELPPPPSFSARAQRAFSFGLSKRPALNASASAATSPVLTSSPTMPAPPSPRERSLTESSYASTAVPLKSDNVRPEMAPLDFSDAGGFGDMFESLGKPKPVSSPAHRTESPPIFPAKSYSRQSYTPSPHGLRGLPSEAESPYTQERRESGDSLLGSSTANSPQLGRESQGFFGAVKQEYALVSTNTSPIISKQSSREYLSASGGDSEFASAESLNRYELHDTQDTKTPVPTATTDRKSTVRFSALPPLAPIAQLADDMEMVTLDTTPKARTAQRSSELDDEPLFDLKPARTRPLPEHSRSEPIVQKRLTKAQFEVLKKYPGKRESETTNAGSDDEYDDVDEIEHMKKVTAQRRKQEANMALYRQQMRKMTGTGPTNLPARPSLDRAASSTPMLHMGGASGTPPPLDQFKPRQQQVDDDEDDDIPLAILQAHGFPSSSKTPGTPNGMGDHRVSMAARNSQLPAFARRLPEDPYFGAGIQNPSARESMAFGSGMSGYGGPARGGLVGVIANEENQRQARRGSPNPQTGAYGQLPANMPGMNRTSSMASLQQQQMYMNGGMPMLAPPSDNAQLQQFIQAQMAMMQNMQNMIHMQQAQINGQMMPPAAAPGLPRPMSMASNLGAIQPASNQGRAMSMMGLPSTFNLSIPPSRPLTSFDPRASTYAPSVAGLGPAPGYTPSIAPSERSNVGQPSRYRPVTAGGDTGSRTHSLTSQQTLNAFQFQQQQQQGAAASGPRPISQLLPKSTIRVVDRAKNAPRMSTMVANDDEDEEGNWAAMVRKKLKGKRGARASKNAEDRVALAELYPNVE